MEGAASGFGKSFGGNSAGLGDESDHRREIEGIRVTPGWWVRLTEGGAISRGEDHHERNWLKK